MSTPIDNIFRSAIKHRPLNILVYMFDGCFEHYLSQAHPEHHFYCIKQTIKVQYNNSIWYDDVNLHLVTAPPMNIVFDYVICNDISQYKSAETLAQLLHVPMIFIEHTAMPLPPDPIPNPKRHYITHKIKEGNYLPYGVKDIEVTDDKNGVILISEFAPRDTVLVQELVEKIHHPISIYGSNIGISKPISNHNEYIDILSKALVYLHITTDPYTPINLLHAMAAGCIVIASESPLVKTLVPPECGFVVRSMQELVRIVNKVYDNKEEYAKYGHGAKNFIKENFSLENFKINTSNILRDDFYI